jgi:hypothetical protein
MMALLATVNTQLVVRRPTHGRKGREMLHWKARLAYVAVIAALLASFLAEGEGWAW